VLRITVETRRRMLMVYISTYGVSIHTTGWCLLHKMRVIGGKWSKLMLFHRREW
jgi:hypothetical protein